MKIPILNGEPDASTAFDGYVARPGRPARRDRATRCSLIELRDLDLKGCSGCFGCWVKTPGECAKRDDSATVCRARGRLGSGGARFADGDGVHDGAAQTRRRSDDPARPPLHRDRGRRDAPSCAVRPLPDDGARARGRPRHRRRGPRHHRDHVVAHGPEHEVESRIHRGHRPLQPRRSHMHSLLLLNGSPRGPRSNSMKMLTRVGEGWQSAGGDKPEVLHLARQGDCAASRRGVRRGRHGASGHAALHRLDARARQDLHRGACPSTSGATTIRASDSWCSPGSPRRCTRGLSNATSRSLRLDSGASTRGRSCEAAARRSRRCPRGRTRSCGDTCALSAYRLRLMGRFDSALLERVARVERFSPARAAVDVDRPPGTGDAVLLERATQEERGLGEAVRRTVRVGIRGHRARSLEDRRVLGPGSHLGARASTLREARVPPARPNRRLSPTAATAPPSSFPASIACSNSSSWSSSGSRTQTGPRGRIDARATRRRTRPERRRHCDEGDRCRGAGCRPMSEPST